MGHTHTPRRTEEEERKKKGGREEGGREGRGDRRDRREEGRGGIERGENSVHIMYFTIVVKSNSMHYLVARQIEHCVKSKAPNSLLDMCLKIGSS